MALILQFASSDRVRAVEAEEAAGWAGGDLDLGLGLAVPAAAVGFLQNSSFSIQNSSFLIQNSSVLLTPQRSRT